MGGNVCEWVEDWYHNSYDAAPANGSAWIIPPASVRVLRGGSFEYDDKLRASSRIFYEPSDSSNDWGFRCCRSACEPDCAGKECGDDACGGSCGECAQGGKDCDNGTCVVPTTPAWKDPGSPWTWQNPPSDGVKTRADAVAYCSGLQLDGGGWSLPNVEQLRSLVRGCDGTVTGGPCAVTQQCLGHWCDDTPNTCNDPDCQASQGPADGCYWPDEMEGVCTWYWSDSIVEGLDGTVWWVVSFDDAQVIGSQAYGDIEGLEGFVRCVK